MSWHIWRQPKIRTEICPDWVCRWSRKRLALPLYLLRQWGRWKPLWFLICLWNHLTLLRGLPYTLLHNVGLWWLASLLHGALPWTVPQVEFQNITSVIILFQESVCSSINWIVMFLLSLTRSPIWCVLGTLAQNKKSWPERIFFYQMWLSISLEEDLSSFERGLF